LISLLSEEKPPFWTRTVDYWRPTARYCMQTEAHVYALAVAASVLLSFYPFLIVVLSFCRNVLHWRAALDAVSLALDDYFPGDLGNFIWRNLPARGNVQWLSMLLLLVTANGIFEPLEVALNRVWKAPANRSYVKNQLVALGLIFLCGGLALASLMLTAMNQTWVARWNGAHTHPASWINLLLFKLAAVPISTLALFFIYWLLPNRKIQPLQVVPVAILVGLVLEALKYITLLVWPLLSEKLLREYGVFHNSVTILLWSFLSAMIVLAGAEWSARRLDDQGNGTR
jgi:YihY family inner membrane protein